MCIHGIGTEAGLKQMTKLPVFSWLNEENQNPEHLVTGCAYPMKLWKFPFCSCSDSHLVNKFNWMMRNNPYHARREDIPFNVYHLFVTEETCSTFPTLLLHLWYSPLKLLFFYGVLYTCRTRYWDVEISVVCLAARSLFPYDKLSFYRLLAVPCTSYTSSSKLSWTAFPPG